MEYKEMMIDKYGNIVEKKSVTVYQNALTSECWLIQFQGLSACKNCESKGKNCGGKNIRKTLKNKLGYKVSKTEGVNG